jgi:hypothetical protein
MQLSLGQTPDEFLDLSHIFQFNGCEGGEDQLIFGEQSPAPAPKPMTALSKPR